MFKFVNFRRVVLSAVVAGAALVGAGSSAQACEYYWKTVTYYVSVNQPCVSYRTVVDHCGYERQVREVSYRTVSVPVTKRVLVTY